MLCRKRSLCTALQYLFECGTNMAIFLYEVFLLKLSIVFLKLLYLLYRKAFATINFNGGVLFYPFTKCRLLNTIFFTELSFDFSVLVERDERFFKIVIILVVIICSHDNTPSLCVIYCNRLYIYVSIFISIIQVQV